MQVHILVGERRERIAVEQVCDTQVVAFPDDHEVVRQFAGLAVAMLKIGLEVRAVTANDVGKLRDGHEQAKDLLETL
jgi:hypothetical protein